MIEAITEKVLFPESTRIMKKDLSNELGWIQSRKQKTLSSGGDILASSERIKQSVLNVFGSANKTASTIFENLRRKLEEAGPNQMIWLLAVQTMLL